MTSATRPGVRNTTGFYGIDTFKAGGCTLHALELDEVGPVAGKRLLHLQCHFGLDALSWARRGQPVFEDDDANWRNRALDSFVKQFRHLALAAPSISEPGERLRAARQTLSERIQNE